MADTEHEDASRKQAWVVPPTGPTAARLRGGAPVPEAPVAADWNLEGLALDPATIEAGRAQRAREALPWDALPDGASTMFDAPVLEQWIGQNNLVPAYWLEDGAARARTVCKVDASGVDYANRRGSWSGTGFLVAPDILCTNHHVINSREVAAGSRALFDFAASSGGGLRQTTTYRLRPDLLFWTSPITGQGGLDATFVALEGPADPAFGHNPLRRQSFAVGSQDKLNIIQHPSGRLKEVALRDNTVVFQDARVVHYESDTEPGSSGAAVYNDAWELVALHHASVANANEGIKFSALASAIEQDAQRGDPAAHRLLQLFLGTDELMGFFGGLGRPVDVAGAGLERVQDAYRGEAHDLDVGFWNIEWFNTRWRDKLDAVARIVVEMNLDVWVLVESGEEATRALAAHLATHYAGEWDVLASESAPPERQITTVLWNTRTARVQKLDWPADVQRWFAVDSRAFDGLGFGLEAVHGRVFDRFPARYRVTSALGRADRSFNLVPVHLKAKAEGSVRRRMASRLLAEAIAETTRAEADRGDWMVGGDFNATLASGDFDALAAAGLTPLSARDAEAGQFTYVKDPYRSLIDHLYVSPNLVPEQPDDFVIVALDRTLDRFLDVSDHRPVLVRLAFSRPDATASPGIPSLSDEEARRVASGLQQAPRGTEPYLDAAADVASRDRYWHGVSPDRPGFADAVRRVLADTHVRPLRYDPSRHLYPWVDLHPDRLLRSIYSGEPATPEAYIQHDAEADRRRGARLETLGTVAAGVEAADLEAQLEAEFPYNCEHVVPQSWFGKREPMRGDLHHLFACESRCNSFRSNHAYTTFPLEAVMHDCGRTEGDRFEPRGGKGAVARATLYFLLRYAGAIDRRYDRAALENLVQWHTSHPPGPWERHRNQAIHAAQGNRNPLIDFPEWTEALFIR